MRGLALGAALMLSLGSQSTEHQAVRYDPGMMERVSGNRGLPVVECMFSHPTLPIGTWVWVKGVKTGHLERCRSTDTSEDVDRPRHIRNRTIELGFRESLRICGSRWGGAAKDCPVVVWIQGK